MDSNTGLGGEPDTGIDMDLTMELQAPGSPAHQSVTSFKSLPYDVLIEVASYIQGEIIQRPPLLTLTRSWYNATLPIFYRDVFLSDVDLWKHMDCQCAWQTTLPKMIPHIESFSFEQLVYEYPDFEDEWIDWRSDLMKDDRLHSVHCDHCGTKRQMQVRLAKNRHTVIPNLRGRLGKLFDALSQCQKLKQLEVDLTSQPHRDFPSFPVNWWANSHIQRVLALEHLTSLRLCLDSGSPFSKQGHSFHLCELLAAKMHRLKRLFISSDRLCSSILPSDLGEMSFPMEDLTIAIVPPRKKDVHPEGLLSESHCLGKTWKWGDVLQKELRHKLIAFRRCAPNARRLRMAGYDDERQLWMADPRFCALSLVDVVSGVGRTRRINKCDARLVQDEIWRELDQWAQE